MTIGEQIVDVDVWQIVEEATEAAEVPGRDRTLQSTVERNPDVPVPGDEVQHWTEGHISDIPVPQAVEGLVEVLMSRVVDVKTMDVQHAQFVDKAVGTTAAVQRQVPMIQTVNEEEVHESADHGGPNVFGCGKFAGAEFLKQMQETCNPKSEHLSPNNEKQNILARIPGTPEVETRKTRVVQPRLSTEFSRRRQSKYGSGSKERPDL